jgi:hypothetical protein
MVYGQFFGGPAPLAFIFLDIGDVIKIGHEYKFPYLAPGLPHGGTLIALIMETGFHGSRKGEFRGRFLSLAFGAPLGFTIFFQIPFADILLGYVLELLSTCLYSSGTISLLTSYTCSLEMIPIEIKIPNRDKTFPRCVLQEHL